MLIFPAIDLYEGKAVRLYKGDYAQKTVYGDDPLVFASDFETRISSATCRTSPLSGKCLVMERYCAGGLWRIWTLPLRHEGECVWDSDE